MQDITFAKLPPEIHARIVKVDPDAAIPMLHATLALAAHEQGGIVYPATGKLHPHGFIASNPAIRKRIMPLLTEIEPRTLHKLLNDATVSESSEDALPSFDAEQCKRYLSEWRHLMQSTNDMASAEMKQVLNKIAESSDFGQSIDSASDQPSARPRSASEQRALGEHNRLRRLAVGAFAGKVFESNPQSILHDSDVKSLVRIAAFVKNPFISGQAMSFLTYNEQRAFVDERQNIQRPASHTFSSPYAARFFDLIENGLHAFIGGKEKAAPTGFDAYDSPKIARMIEMIRAGYRSYGNRHAPFFAVWGLPAAQRGTAFCDIADAYAPILQTRRERLPYFDDAASGRIMECIDALAKRNLNDPQT